MADKEPASDKIMTAAKMKPLLALSKREPVQAAVGLTADGDGVVLLDKKLKPKKVLAMLKAEAAKAKIQLQPSTLRFGKAEVDPEYDPGMVRFFVNKEAPGNMRAKLVVVFKQAAYSKVEFNVDPSFEEEPEDEQESQEKGANGLAVDPLKQAYEAKIKEIEPQALDALKGQRGDTSKIRAVLAFAQEKATGGDYKAGLAGLDALAKLLVAAGPSPNAGSKGPTVDPLKQAYAAKIAEMEPQALDALQGQRGDTSKIRAVLAFAQEKATGGDYKAGLAGLDALAKLLVAAGPSPNAPKTTGTSAPPTPPPQAPTPPTADALAKELAALALRIPGAGPAQKAVLAKLATDANVNIKTNNLNYAAGFIAQLRAALDNAGTAPQGDGARTGVKSGTPGNWPAIRQTWQSASDTVDDQIAALQKALRDSGDEDYQEIAEYGLNAITGNYKVRLMAAMREVDGGGARDKLAKLVDDFSQHIATDERVMAVDENPLEIAVSVRATLGPALQAMRAALA